MAEERKGHLYEIVTGAALLRGFPGCDINTQVTLSGATIRSDWIISRGSQVEGLVLVTHSGAETKNTQKFWRDVAEVLQGLRSTGGKLRVIAVLFDDNVLEELIKAETSIVNHLVRCTEIGDCKALISIPNSKLAHVSLDKANSWETTKTSLPVGVVAAGELAIRSLARIFGRFSKEKTPASSLASALRVPRDPGEHLLEPSYFYQGCASIMLVDEKARPSLLEHARKNRLPPSASPILQRIGGVKAIGGYRPSAALRWVAEYIDSDLLTTALGKHEAPKAKIYRAMLRSSPHLGCFVSVLQSAKYRTPNAYLELLESGFRRPCRLAIELLGSGSEEDLRFNWPWTFLVTIVRELKGKKQGFGASEIARITGNRRLCVQNSLVSDFECCERSLETTDLRRLADYFCSSLGTGLSKLDPSSLEERLLHEVFVDKLGPHAVHPIPALTIEIAQRHGVKLEREWLQTSFGAMVTARGTAASVRMLADPNNIIWWRSAHEGNEAHKSKEVGARIFGVTTRWGPKESQIYRSSKGKRFIFIVDGDFQKEHLEFFYAAGADELLRPQELLEKLPHIAGW